MPRKCRLSVHRKNEERKKTVQCNRHFLRCSLLQRSDISVMTVSIPVKHVLMATAPSLSILHEWMLTAHSIPGG